MHIALVGPCSPVDVVDLLDSADGSAASGLLGDPGVPVSELAKGLVGAGHQVLVVTTASAIPGSSVEFSGPRFRIVVQRSRPRPRDYLRDFYGRERRGMVSILRDAAPDIVHAHWTYEFELGAQDSGLLHVTTARDDPWTILSHVPDAYRLARLGVAWRARPGIKHLIVASPYMKAAWRRQMMYRREIQVIPNMAPSLPVVEVAKARAPTAVCVADTSRRKNVELLARAFSRVRRQLPGARLRLAGFGLAESDPFARMLASRDLTDGIDFLGRLGRAQLAVEIASSWCLVHPSLEESFGNTLVEALLLGTPVIGGRASGAVPWVLGGGRAGTLVDVRSVSALSDVLIAHLEDGPLEPPEYARTLLDSRYSKQRVVQAHLGLYETVYSGHGH